ncbi:MAG: hypothetical protein ACTSPV_13335 [Candidatus Hodarchaeales archaeon]
MRKIGIKEVIHFKDVINSNSITKEFIFDFVRYWEEVLQIIKPKGVKFVNWTEWDKIVKEPPLFGLTEGFCQRWKNTGIVSWFEPYIKTYGSFVLHFRGGLVLLPRQFILLESFQSSELLREGLKSNPTQDEFIRIIDALFDDLNVRLKPNDLKILQKISTPIFSKSLDKFPKIKELAYWMRKDPRTISSRLQYVMTVGVLSHIYLVDMARIGYNTIQIKHETPKKEIPKSVFAYLLLHSPLKDGTFQSVIQIPYTDTQKITEIKRIFQPKSWKNLHLQFRGWNFSGLTTDPSKRWILRPPLLQRGGSWKTKIILPRTGIEFNLDPYFEPYPISIREARILSIVSNMSSMKVDYIAEVLSISRQYVTESWKQLLRRKIIFRFPVFNNIGLGSWIYFTMDNIGSKDNLENIICHLKFFPYLNLYYSPDEGFLTGLTNIPLNWTHSFIYRLNSLVDTYDKIKTSFYLGPDAYFKWGSDIQNTFNWKKDE